MKKRRRIEITTFRRRTTIVLRDRSNAGRMRTEGDDEDLPQKHVELVRAARSYLDQTQTEISDNTGDLGVKQSRK